MRIAVIGYSGSGKSTLAARLGDIYSIPILHLDQVQFSPGWVERGREEALSMVEEFMLNNHSWVIDGDYSKFLQDERLAQADRIIFLNLPRRVCFFKAFGRYLEHRGRTRADMADGCPEKFDLEFAKWLLLDGRSGKIRAHYRKILAAYPQKTLVFKSMAQTDAWLASQEAKTV